MARNISALLLASALGLSSQSACAVNSPQQQPSADCRVSGGEKLPPETGGADALCEAIRKAAAAQAPGLGYSVDVQVVSPSMLSARVTLADGRTLPERKHAIMDRTLTRSSLQRFADSLGAALAEAAPR
jgi:hypothetical protein